MASNEEPEEEFTARPYQTTLYESAKRQNTIVCLGTGTGKTYIAILLMKDPEFSRQLKGDFLKGVAKRTLFLVPTRPLVEQQVRQIRRHFEAKVKGYVGDEKVDKYKDKEWTDEMCGNEVLVMTPDILLQAIDSSFISMERINVLIIDEVHWAAKRKGNKDSGHTYKQIMNRYKELELKERPRPRVLGLSACLINSSIGVRDLDNAIIELEQTYCAVCITAPQLCGTHPTEEIYTYVSQPLDLSPTAQTVVKALETFIRYLRDLKQTIKGIDDTISTCVSRIRTCLANIKNMFTEPMDITKSDTSTMACMGVWCTSCAIEQHIEEMIPYRDLYANINPILSQLLDLVIIYLSAIKAQFEPELVWDPMAPLNTASPKMHALRELLLKFKPMNGQKSKLCGIVFVDQRSVAKVLADWLNKLKEVLPNEYQFLNVHWVVGHSSRPGFESLVKTVSENKQQEIIKQFHTQEVNLLVATSVLEEGLDVRKCNLVVRYDKIHTFRQYLQSKGRARAEEAIYCMISSLKESTGLKAELEKFIEMERLLKNLNKRQRASGDDHSSNGFCAEE